MQFPKIAVPANVCVALTLVQYPTQNTGARGCVHVHVSAVLQEAHVIQPERVLVAWLVARSANAVLPRLHMRHREAHPVPVTQPQILSLGLIAAAQVVIAELSSCCASRVQQGKLKLTKVGTVPGAKTRDLVAAETPGRCIEWGSSTAIQKVALVREGHLLQLVLTDNCTD